MTIGVRVVCGRFVGEAFKQVKMFRQELPNFLKSAVFKRKVELFARISFSTFRQSSNFSAIFCRWFAQSAAHHSEFIEVQFAEHDFLNRTDWFGSWELGVGKEMSMRATELRVWRDAVEDWYIP